MARRPQVDQEILQMALAGYEQEKIKIDAAIASIQARLGRPSGVFAVTDQATPNRRTMSAAARKRIAAAQRKRWAAQRQAKETAAPTKRKLSAAGRKSDRGGYPKTVGGITEGQSSEARFEGEGDKKPRESG
jgi:hypothetical protein